MRKEIRQSGQEKCGICGKSITTTYTLVVSNYREDDESHTRRNWESTEGKMVGSNDIDISFGSRLKDVEMLYFPRFVCNKCTKKKNYKELVWKNEFNSYAERIEKEYQRTQKIKNSFNQ